jgi:hypothetical protein
MLDGHSDLFTTSSLEQDYTSFTGLISYSGSFPYMAQEGFEIRPGYHNMISLSALKVDADDSLRDLDITARNCRFYDESSDLKIYKDYTYTNCLFECSLLAAKAKHGCIPWYFPSGDDNITICNPWITKEFLEEMKKIKKQDCIKCYAECSSTIYDNSITTIPFRKCDLANMEMSFLCNFSGLNYRPVPKKYYSQMNKTLEDDSEIFFNYRTNIRNYSSLNQEYFPTNEYSYDAYEIDIAIVDIYFSKSSVLQMGRTSTMNWVDYLSTVGGLLGLVLGMGFVSFIELAWLAIRMGARSLHLTHWIA